MNTPLWAAELADQFWALTGEPAPPAPRDLIRPIALGLPLGVVQAPRLHGAGVERWLRRQDILCTLGGRDRTLRACLVARFGQGAIFLDSADPDDERRFSLAHELAHFLRHYRQQRLAARRARGPEILQVLDGVRPPRYDERAHALLAQVRLGYHGHLMERDADGTGISDRVRHAEAEADLLACELLAPASKVDIALHGTVGHERHNAAVVLLCRRYGLPAAAARQYAARIASRPTQQSSLLQRLRAAP